MRQLEPTRTSSDLTATDELRHLLDERGVEYEGSERSLRWRDRYGIMIQAFPLASGELGMGVWSCTPEQAIAATLGAGTCKVESTTKWDWDRCEPYWVHVLSCGHTVTTMEPEPPCYCSDCGRKVVADG